MTLQLPLLRALFLATGSLIVTSGVLPHDPDGRALVVRPLTGTQTPE